MKFIQHSLCTDILKAPPGIKEEECAALPIRRGEEQVASFWGESVPIVQSFWLPEPEELKALNEGHPVMMTIWGRTHPPLRLEVCATKE